MPHSHKAGSLGGLSFTSQFLKLELAFIAIARIVSILSASILPAQYSCICPGLATLVSPPEAIQ